jgi:hypothetical protein
MEGTYKIEMTANLLREIKNEPTVTLNLDVGTF